MWKPWNKGLTKETDPRVAKYAENLKGENNPMFGCTKEKNPFYGQHHTEETKAKARATKRGEEYIDLPQPKEIRCCIECGKLFEVETRSERRFCSPSCNAKYYWRTKDNTERCKKIGVALDKKVEITCEYCGKKFKIHRYRVETAKYCSLDCFGKAHSGENAAAWSGGTSNLPYPFDFNEELRELIRRRDNYTCQLCGKSQEENGEQYEERLSIHHIDYVKENCDPENLVSLCRDCHLKTNMDRKNWIKLFQLKLRN